MPCSRPTATRSWRPACCSPCKSMGLFCLLAGWGEGGPPNERKGRSLGAVGGGLKVGCFVHMHAHAVADDCCGALRAGLMTERAWREARACHPEAPWLELQQAIPPLTELRSQPHTGPVPAKSEVIHM